MKRFYRIEHEGRPRHVIEEGGIWRLLEGELFAGHEPGATIAATGHRLLAPIVPSKIVAVGLNYKDHAAEVNKPLPSEPLMFLKPSTAVIGPDETIVIPDGAGRIDHEAEVGVVIGATASRVREQDAHDYVFGLTCVNDVTARELQKKDVQYTRAKGFDTFAPLGPCIATGIDYAFSGGHPGRRLGQRRPATIVDHPAVDLPDRPADRIHLVGHDAAAWRHHLDRHSGRDRAAQGRRSCHDQSRGRRRTEQPGGQSPNLIGRSQT